MEAQKSKSVPGENAYVNARDQYLFSMYQPKAQSSKSLIPY